MTPPRPLVGLYVMTAHTALALAFGLVAWNPHAVAGFFYHSWIVGIVHLITIGWIAMSILGNVYVILPMACGLPFPARKADYAAYGFVTIGLIGMVSHFWIAEFGGMAWSAAAAAAGVTHVMVRLAWNLRRARIPGGVKLHVYFACANIVGAATFGVVLGFDKVHHFLPGYVLSNVFAHAHLAAVGWVCMMAMGFAYRLIPMVIPSASPSGPTIYISAILIETGVLGLFVSLLMRSGLTLMFASVIAAGFAAFGGHVVWMLDHAKPAHVGRHHPDFAAAHLATAGGWLLFAIVCGLILTALPMSEWTLRAALLYGVFGLVGCLSQIIVGFERRTLAIAAAYWSLERGGATESPPTSNALRRAVVYYAWLAGVPALAGGFFLNVPMVLAAGASLLFAAALLMLLDVAIVVWDCGPLPAAQGLRAGRACDRCA